MEDNTMLKSEFKFFTVNSVNFKKEEVWKELVNHHKKLEKEQRKPKQSK